MPIFRLELPTESSFVPWMQEELHIRQMFYPAKNTPKPQAASKPKYFIIGAKDFDLWLQGRKAMGQTYACIKNGNEYIMLDPEWIAHVTNTNNED